MTSYYGIGFQAGYILSLLMGGWVLFFTPRRVETRLWTFLSFLVALWFFGRWLAFTALDENHAFKAQQILYSGAILINVVYFNFVLAFLDRPIRQNRFMWMGYLAAIILFVCNWTGKLFVICMRAVPGFNYVEMPGPLYLAHTLSYAIFPTAGMILLYREQRSAEGIRKNHIRYLLAASLVGFLSGWTTFPMAFNSPVPFIGGPLVSIYLVLIGFGIYRHRLMAARLIVRKTVIYSSITVILTMILVFISMLSAHLAEGILGYKTLYSLVAAGSVITAIFHPLHRRIQAFVDRYFFSSWADQPVAREIAAGFSHELKSPLAGLSLQAQLALAELEDVEEGKVSWLKALPQIKSELQYLVNQAMDAARRIEAVRGVAEPARGQMGPVKISDLVDNSLTHLRELVRQSKAEIRCVLPTGLAPVYGDAKQLEIVFINLIKNALQAIDDMGGASLIVSGQDKNDSVLVSIKDSGPGISAKVVQKIFEPNFTTKGHKGTGMGLYLAQQILKAHNGSVGVRSTEGKGTEFIVTLPKLAAERSPGFAA
jgi:signal transduction histidine kinase